MTTVLGILVVIFLGVWAIASFFRPPLVMVLMIVFYPLKQCLQTYLPFFAMHSSAFNFIVATIVGVAIAGSLRVNPNALRGYKSGYFALTAFLYIYAIVAMLWTPSESYQYASDLLIAGFPYWLLQVVLLPVVLSSSEQFRSTFGATLIVGIIVSILFLVNPAGIYHNGRYVLQIGQSAALDLGNPLASAQMGGQLLFIAALLVPGGSKLFWFLVRATAIVLGLILAVRAGSRGQLVGSVFLAIAMYPIARKVRNINQFLLTGAGLAVIAAIGYLTIVLVFSSDATEASRWNTKLATKHLDERFDTALLLINWWLSEPSRWMFGLGSNAFSSLPGYGGSYVHNAIIEMCCEYGLFGLAVYGTVCYLTFKYSLELFRRHRDVPTERAASAILIAFGLYSFILSLKQGALLGAPEPYFFWILIAKINLGERAALANQAAAMAEQQQYQPDGAYPGYEDVAAAYGNS